MSIECTLNVPSKHMEFPYNVHAMYIECTLKVHYGSTQTVTNLGGVGGAVLWEVAGGGWRYEGRSRKSGVMCRRAFGGRSDLGCCFEACVEV